MTLRDWLDLCASDPAAANALCGEAMGWELTDDGSTWCRDGECLRGIEDLSPITDRNHAAMMVERVLRQGHGGALLGNIGHAIDPKSAAVVGAIAVATANALKFLVINPALIAWACVEALKKEEA